MAIAPYNAKIEDYLSFKMIGKPLWDIFYGVELEYEINKKSKFVLSQPEISTKIPGEFENSPMAHHICDILMAKYLKPCHSFIKRDGSLSDGLEIVTLPMDIREFQGPDKKGSAPWIKFFNDMADFGLTVRSTCGMHVHVSKEFLTPLQIGKMLKFIHCKDNFEFIKCIAGRTPPNRYANIVDPKKVTDVHKHYNRYDGINLTNPKTVEFRIFKASTKIERVLANIEFCDALVFFTWPSNAGVMGSNLSEFLKFVLRNRKQYPNLFGLLVSKKFFEKPKKPNFKKFKKG